MSSLRRRSALLVPVLLATVGGCDTIVADELELGSIEVRTRTLGGDSVPGVRLHLFTGTRLVARGTTGFDGRHVFGFVAPESYGVFAFLPEGHTWPGILLGEPVRDIVSGMEIEEAGRDSATFVFLRLGEGGVRVEVVDESGAGVAGTGVELVRNGQVARSSETGSDGVVLLEGLPHGLYELRVNPPDGWTGADGVPPPAEGFLVEGGTIRDFVVELERS